MWFKRKATIEVAQAKKRTIMGSIKKKVMLVVKIAAAILFVFGLGVLFASWLFMFGMNGKTMRWVVLQGETVTVVAVDHDRLVVRKENGQIIDYPATNVEKRLKQGDRAFRNRYRNFELAPPSPLMVAKAEKDPKTSVQTLVPLRTPLKSRVSSESKFDVEEIQFEGSSGRSSLIVANPPRHLGEKNF